MVDTDTIVELLPHYLAMLIVVTLVLAVVRRTTGGVGFVGELVVVLAVVFAYPFVVRRLGVAPSVWE